MRANQGGAAAPGPAADHPPPPHRPETSGQGSNSLDEVLDYMGITPRSRGFYPSRPNRTTKGFGRTSTRFHPKDYVDLTRKNGVVEPTVWTRNSEGPSVYHAVGEAHEQHIMFMRRPPSVSTLGPHSPRKGDGSSPPRSPQRRPTSGRASAPPTHAPSEGEARPMEVGSSSIGEAMRDAAAATAAASAAEGGALVPPQFRLSVKARGPSTSGAGGGLAASTSRSSLRDQPSTSSAADPLGGMSEAQMEAALKQEGALRAAELQHLHTRKAWTTPGPGNYNAPSAFKSSSFNARLNVGEIPRPVRYLSERQKPVVPLGQETPSPGAYTAACHADFLRNGPPPPAGPALLAASVQRDGRSPMHPKRFPSISAAIARLDLVKPLPHVAAFHPHTPSASPGSTLHHAALKHAVPRACTVPGRHREPFVIRTEPLPNAYLPADRPPEADLASSGLMHGMAGRAGAMPITVLDSSGASTAASAAHGIRYRAFLSRWDTVRAAGSPSCTAAEEAAAIALGKWQRRQVWRWLSTQGTVDKYTTNGEGDPDFQIGRWLARYDIGMGTRGGRGHGTDMPTLADTRPLSSHAPRTAIGPRGHK